MTTLIAKHTKDNTLTQNVYPDIVHEEVADLSQDFGIEIDDICQDIFEACKGWGTDNARLIEAMANLKPEQRHKVSLRYNDKYEKKLRTVMKKETGSGDYGMALQFLALSPVEAECAMIKHACDGFGTNELALYPIVCGRSNKDMNLLKRTYYKIYSKDLGKLMSSELGGNLYKLVASCLQGAEEEFDPDFHTEERAQDDAEDFYKAGQGRWFGTKGKDLFKTLALSPPRYLTMLDAAYSGRYGYTLAKALEKCFRGDAEEAALFTLGMKLEPNNTVAKLIKKACKGLGTNELLLTSCIIRYTDILSHVNIAHIELFSKSLHSRVRGETRGNYLAILIGLLHSVIPEE